MKEDIKVGDTVEVISNFNGGCSAKIGEKHIVAEVCESNYRLDTYSSPFITKDAVKLINRQMKKEDLKTGMRVELRNGGTYIVLLGLQDGDLIVDKDGFNYFGDDDYNKDLTESSGMCDFDIINVYNEPTATGFMINPSKKGELLWSREEEVKEYTMEEAIKLVGHEFKIKKS